MTTAKRTHLQILHGRCMDIWRFADYYRDAADDADRAYWALRMAIDIDKWLSKARDRNG